MRLYAEAEACGERRFYEVETEGASEGSTEMTNETTTKKLSGAAAKAARQAKMRVVATPDGAATEATATPEATAPEASETPTETAAKPAKPARPAKTLDDIIARQVGRPIKWLAVGLANGTDARVRAGQPRGAAMAEVIAQYQSIALTALAERREGGTVEAAVDRWFAENAPGVLSPAMREAALRRYAHLRERDAGETPADAAEADAAD